MQPYPETRLQSGDPAARWSAREGIELAFVTALQALPPRQTAALVLYDVLGFTLTDVAEMLDAAPTGVKGLLQRARAAMPAPTPVSTADAHERLASQFAAALEADDVEAVVALLTDEAWLAMPPATERYDGPRAIAGFLGAAAVGRAGEGFRLAPTRASGHPAFGTYLRTRARGILVVVPDRDATRCAGLVHFLDDDLHRHFGLLDVLR